MAITTSQTISLDEEFVHEEYIAAGTIKPGYLVEVVNSSGVAKVQAHSTAKGFAEKAFAVEDALQGKTISDSYSATDLVSVHIHENGSRVYAWLKAGTAYVIGDKLESAGDGTLQKASGSADLEIVAILTMPLDLSGSGAVAAQAIVRVL